MLIKIFTCVVISQIFILGVFANSAQKYIVVNENENLCGEFIRGTKQEPNWLMDNWFSIQYSQKLTDVSQSSISCLESDTAGCCRDLGYRYAGVSIGTSNIGEQRRSAEFLASKKIIETQSLIPEQYKLNNLISRKETMKLIMNISEIKIIDRCLEIFSDVENDWSCKYIESALENDFIVGYQGFRPNEPITTSEALKLIFKARNIEKRYNTEYWQQDYLSSAYYLGYIDEKTTNFNRYIQRGEFFEIIARTYQDFKIW